MRTDRQDQCNRHVVGVSVVLCGFMHDDQSKTYVPGHLLIRLITLYTRAKALLSPLIWYQNEACNSDGMFKLVGGSYRSQL